MVLPEEKFALTALLSKAITLRLSIMGTRAAKGAATLFETTKEQLRSGSRVDGM
jgi:hypothetical protein